ncbi:bifunctional pyr operon transcriptional regulator/uracil phosphoribosyltransferase PyrR [Micromonospora echinofusca]|uniref:Bifunctional protein PyrR n=1 Tax=Micromonospora echinofusca TaxID=47858 RepID=A0ABS3VSD5_MICEH|nr:bifunctional pyr operon transcriptional regulator/uracil phosphoribosyltransferase PyrR [Micromonospora echinofusca]MBO4207428.1 bifunctional pyr operon transcriptional regulator/uracil phosphoribosyltransferase PyrR [Micromonospora echinofusca]
MAYPQAAQPPVPSGTADQVAQPPSVKVILTSADVQRVVDRIAHQILEKTQGAADTVLLGIPTRGAPLARRLADRINAFETVDVPVGVLDITLYRDDLRRHATRKVGPTQVPPGGIDGKRIVLVDDVLFSGRTIRAALDALSDLGRPSSVQLAVLVDRGHRQLPIRADYVGKNIPTALSENVRVTLAETDGLDEVRLFGGINQ